MSVPTITVTAYDKAGVLQDSLTSLIRLGYYHLVPMSFDDFKLSDFYLQYVAEHGAITDLEAQRMHTVEKQKVFQNIKDLEAMIRKNERSVQLYSPLTGGFVYKHYTYTVDINYPDDFEGDHKFTTRGVYYKIAGFYKNIGWNW